VIDRGPARECDMIAAFLQAEISSPRYSSVIQMNLDYYGLSRAHLIDCPDLGDELQNHIRRQLMKYRGYGTDSHLFEGFPPDADWRFIEIEPRDHHMIYCANDTSEKSWVDMSESTRSIGRIAENISRMEKTGSAKEQETAARVRSIQKDLRDGKPIAPLIAVAGDENGRLVLVEGHSRATAYVNLKWQHNVSILLGRSAKLKEWRYY
jgi:hypothetical protein